MHLRIGKLGNYSALLCRNYIILQSNYLEKQKKRKHQMTRVSHQKYLNSNFFLNPKRKEECIGFKMIVFFFRGHVLEQKNYFNLIVESVFW